MIQEWNANDLHSEIFVEPIRFENGYITPPTGPGLGVELDEAVVARQREGLSREARRAVYSQLRGWTHRPCEGAD
jgi:hypothetical protein